jgi:RIO kinase 3
LWHDKECWYIDVSQSVEPNHPHGLEFLLRDCRNVSDFFNKRNAHDVKSAEELFTDITGLPLDADATEAEIFSQVSKVDCCTF